MTRDVHRLTGRGGLIVQLARDLEPVSRRLNAELGKAMAELGRALREAQARRRLQALQLQIRLDTSTHAGGLSQAAESLREQRYRMLIADESRAVRAYVTRICDDLRKELGLP